MSTNLLIIKCGYTVHIYIFLRDTDKVINLVGFAHFNLNECLSMPHLNGYAMWKGSYMKQTVMLRSLIFYFKSRLSFNPRSFYCKSQPQLTSWLSASDLNTGRGNFEGFCHHQMRNDVSSKWWVGRLSRGLGCNSLQK